MDKTYKLNYSIGERRALTVVRTPLDPRTNGAVAEPPLEMEMVSIVWTHEDGFPPDMRDIPMEYSVIDFVLGAMLTEAAKRSVITPSKALEIKALTKQVFTPHPLRSSLGIIKVPDGERKVIGDQVNVPLGTPNSIVAMMMEEKREKLAQSIGVEP